MKKVLSFLFVFSTSTLVFADYIPIPDDNPLTNLPDDAVILAKKDIVFSIVDDFSYFRKFTGDGKGYHFNYSKSLISKGSTLAISNMYQTNYYATPVFFHQIKPDSGETNFFWFNIKNQSKAIWIALWQFTKDIEQSPRTVKDFNEWVGGDFQLVHDNPYEGLDEKTKIDIIMVKITNAIKEERYKDALPYFNDLERNNSNLPESFYFYQIQSLFKSNLSDEAKDKARDYLKKYGSNAKYYAEVIEIMGR